MSTLYQCKPCSYTTTDKRNYQKHINTKKHNEKMQELFDILSSQQEFMEIHDISIFKCPYCSNSYSNSGNLSRHKILCSVKQQLIDQCNVNINEKNLIITNQNELLKQKDETINVLNDEVKHLKLLINSAGSIINNSMSALSYAMKHYKDAPVLETIKDYSALKYNQNDTEFIENLLVEYKNKLLPTYLGNFIIKTYKKDDPSTQSIWNSDTNRLTYVIKEILNNNKTDWQIDKKGIKTTKYIIVPVMDHIEELLRSYIEGFDMTYNLYAPNEAERKMLKLKYSTDILQSIENKVLHDEVLKYIASHFFMNKNSIE